MSMKSSVKMILGNIVKAIHREALGGYARLRPYLFADVYFARSVNGLPRGSLVFFPLQQNLLCCGIAGIVTFINKKPCNQAIDVAELEGLLARIAAHTCSTCDVNDDSGVAEQYLGGDTLIDSLWHSVQVMKNSDPFFTIFSDANLQNQLEQFSKRLKRTIYTEAKQLTDTMGHLDTARVDVMSVRIERLKDIAWCLKSEILANVNKTRDLITRSNGSAAVHTVTLFKKINTVLSSIDRLEVRGRDSAGISILMVVDGSQYEDLEKLLKKENHMVL